MGEKNLENYKCSKFNAFYNKDDVYLVYNTLNTRLYRVSKNIWHYLKKPTNNLQKDITNKIVCKLYDEGLILDDFINEKDLMKYQINSVIFENKLSVTIVPTEACNFRCIYCYESHDSNYMSSTVEQSIVKFFKKQVHDYTSVAINWFGGEALLQKAQILRLMREISDICSKAGVPLYGEIVTNGYLLDVKTFDELVENKLLFYQITIDCDKSLHDKRRPLVDGSPTFDRIIENIINIKKYSRHKHFRIIIRSNIGKNDLSKYHDFISDLSQIIGDDKRFVYSCEPIRDWGGETVEKIKSEISNQSDNLLESLYKDPIYKKQNIFLEDFHSLSDIRCTAGKTNGFLINYDGQIYKCSMASCSSPENKLIGQVGHLKSNGTLCIDKVKNSQFLNVDEPYEHCDNCPWIPMCLLSNCPLSYAKGKKLRCIKNYRGNTYLENVIWNMYIHDNYIKIIEGE